MKQIIQEYNKAYWNFKKSCALPFYSGYTDKHISTKKTYRDLMQTTIDKIPSDIFEYRFVTTYAYMGYGFMANTFKYKNIWIAISGDCMFFCFENSKCILETYPHKSSYLY